MVSTGAVYLSRSNLRVVALSGQSSFAREQAQLVTKAVPGPGGDEATVETLVRSLSPVCPFISCYLPAC